MPPTPPAWAYLRSQLLVTLPHPTHSFAHHTVLVTGSNTGLGLEAARHFARLRAARVILAVRDPARGAAAAASIEESVGRPGVVEVWPLDLASYASVKDFAARAMSLDRLDVVVGNAGLLTRTFSVAEDNERSVTVNVVNTMFLAVLLLPKLRETSVSFDKDVVLTFTSSFVHWMTYFPERKAESILAECASEARANMAGSERYFVSKLMGLLAIRALAADLTASDKPGRVIVSAINPGFVHTEVLRESRGLAFLFEASLRTLLARTAEEGSRTLVHAAQAGYETHGQYLDDCQVGRVSPFVTSDDGVATQRKLWGELKAKFESLHLGATENI